MIKFSNLRTVALALCLLVAGPSFAANRTAWTSGNGQGDAAWGALINSSDMASMAGTTAGSNTVLSSVAGIANGTNNDQFMDISCELTIASSAVAAGANLAFWIYPLQEDGTTYGDGLLTAGTQATLTPAWAPLPPIVLAASTRTSLIGQINGIVIPPETFKVAIQNNSGFALTSGTQTCSFKTYNQNLNN